MVGDHHFTVRVVVPDAREMNDEARGALQELSRLLRRRGAGAGSSSSDWGDASSGS